MKSHAASRVKIPHVKAGQNKQAVEHRWRTFVEAYITNGRNASEACRTAGYSRHTANRQGYQVLARPKVRAMIDARLAEIDREMIITTERTLREVARIAYFDPLKLYDDNGVLKKIIDMDADTRAAIASIEVTPIMSRGTVVGTSKKVKHWPKTDALQMAMRYLGLNERDNAQLHREPIDVTIKFVRAAPRTIEAEDAHVIESSKRARVKALSSESAA